MTQPARDVPEKTSRTIRAPRGTKLTCRSWLTEAPYRMIQNNLDPCSTDSTPTSADQEDHVSMATHAAYRLLKMNDNLGRILGIELLTAAQGLEFRKPLSTSSALLSVLEVVRTEVPPLQNDRFLAPDLEKAAILIRNGKLIKAADKAKFPKIEGA